MSQKRTRNTKVNQKPGGYLKGPVASLPIRKRGPSKSGGSY